MFKLQVIESLFCLFSITDKNLGIILCFVYKNHAVTQASGLQ